MSAITLLDGGFSRELVRFGAELRQPEWSAGALIDCPEAVRKAHDSFYRAGAEIATTGNYAVVPYHIGEERFARRGLELADLAGRLAREAADNVHESHPGARVAGCLPPACGSYQTDRFNPDQARKILAPLVEGLTPYVDFWLAETMSSLAEIQVTAETAAETGKPLWISCTLQDDDNGDADRPPLLRSGETVEDAVALAVDLGAEALLFNCSAPEVMEDAILTARRKLAVLERELPLGVYANAFVNKAGEGEANEGLSDMRADLSPEGYLTWTDRWVAAGATLIGGCCGIGSDHIAAMHDRYKPEQRAGAVA
ncbi:homocysteine S-methyltransferase family protein [Hwanghaeella grinnelliae]|uniref:Homocysteine S-methyltransferase family protein n=1 Tax=Hwanghaeella grinnelliae TaxID=2500179 RepID=A0A3S2ZAP6_9PROT|nr:homocysteine S-methyltransferase family protein [Hwanghaeella grinnelliae]RVU39397.1 homocysteine S-methyltransferase family protein [Hwanghaeella grinnelliae]